MRGSKVRRFEGSRFEGSRFARSGTFAPSNLIRPWNLAPPHLRPFEPSHLYLLSSLKMDVFVIPVGRDRYELYCESQAVPAAPLEEPPDHGMAARLMNKFPILRRMQQRFAEMLEAAEERRHNPEAPAPEGWAGRLQQRMLAWVVERIAEQRLLWNLRGETAVVLVHPQDMTFEQVEALVRRHLRHDYERHLRWLLIDGVLLILAAALTIVPGPNIVAYYFIFRVVGHWLSMRGARRGLNVVTFSSQPSAALTELRDLVTLAPDVREQRIHDIATRLQLPHLRTFFERVAI